MQPTNDTTINVYSDLIISTASVIVHPISQTEDE